MPACMLELTLSPVSRAPHREPFSQVTCCMRVSLLSIGLGCSANGSLMPLSAKEHELLLLQVRCGSLPSFWVDAGGNVYSPTSSLALLRLSAGEPLSELVLVKASSLSGSPALSLSNAKL